MADFQDKGNKMELKFIPYNEDRKPLPLQRNQKQNGAHLLITITCQFPQNGNKSKKTKKRRIMNFTINGTSVPQVEKYDNQGAHNAIKSMMQRKETLSIRLYTDKDNYPYIWIESYNVAGFKYYVTPISFKWIYTYLTTGESEDGGIQPTELTPYQTGEDNNFQLSILKQLVESGKRVQFVPLFRFRKRGVFKLPLLGLIIRLKFLSHASSPVVLRYVLPERISFHVRKHW